MSFAFTHMNEETAATILTWKYEPPYTTYTLQEEGADIRAEMLDRRSPYYAVCDEQGELVGFFNYGTSSLVYDSDQPGIYVDDKTVPVGLGMRPDLTGKGLGQAFVEAGLAFAQQAFAPKQFLLFVYPWNERAIRVYERVGFRHAGVFMQKNPSGASEFLEMRKDG
jgi:ribosomal-protein-alanine N-acetyltransferase